MATACNKDEGTGGTGTIIGHVYSVIHDDDNFLLSTDTIPAAKTDVYIVYGNDSFYGDNCKTGFDGSYRFQYLTPGNYTIYAYSSMPDGHLIAEQQTVTLGNGKSEEVPDIFIHTGKAYGTSMIRGWVQATYFDKNGDPIRTEWAYDHRIYIQRLGQDSYFDDTRIGLDGKYYFQKLQPDTYIIFTFAQNNDETPYPVYDTVVVDQTGVVVDADTLNIRIKA